MISSCYNVQCLLINFGGNMSTENCPFHQMMSMKTHTSCFGVEHLQGQFWNSQGLVLLRSLEMQRNKSNHEEMGSEERNDINDKFF